MTETFRLNTDDRIPKIGFGTFEVDPGTATFTAVDTALKAGYRLIDTAQFYKNEDSVGQAIRESGIARDELFVTTKLWSGALGYQSALDAFEASLSRLGLEYVDLYLIHWPAPFDDTTNGELNRKRRQDTWRAFEELQKHGRTRTIGVSNFVVHHLEELLQHANILPAVNQIELHPFVYEEQRPIVEFCQKYEIVLEAYSPLSRGSRMNAPAVARIAKEHGKTNAQVLIRWAIQHDAVPLPRSTSPGHIAENFDVFDFELTLADMHVLNSLTERAARVAPDPHKMK